MKALTLTIDKYIELRQKQVSDINFRPKIYDLVELEEVPELNLINENWVKIKVKIGTAPPITGIIFETLPIWIAL